MQGVYIALTDTVILTCTQNFVLQVIGVDSVGADMEPSRRADEESGVGIPGAESRQRGSSSALAGLRIAANPSAPNLSAPLSAFLDPSPPSPSSGSPSSLFSNVRRAPTFWQEVCRVWTSEEVSASWISGSFASARGGDGDVARAAGDVA